MKLLKIFEQINAGNFSQMITKMYFCPTGGFQKPKYYHENLVAHVSAINVANIGNRAY